MPELPEVETTLRGIAPHINRKTLTAITVREPRLRRRVRADLPELLISARLGEVRRRAKYLILPFECGLLLIHLGMSGSLRIVTANETTRTPAKHDHIDWLFDDDTLLRYHDPRRFGLVEWFSGAEEHCPMLQKLGVEPLSDAFHGSYLQHQLSGRSCAVKTAIMNAQIVVGVGNIYANESLFSAGIHPHRAAGSLSQAECTRLVAAIQNVLQQAIAAGGSSLRDFIRSDGSLGYFQQQYRAYARAGQPCVRCATPIVRTLIAQRSSFYCPHCQRAGKKILWKIPSKPVG